MKWHNLIVLMKSTICHIIKQIIDILFSSERKNILVVVMVSTKAIF